MRRAVHVRTKTSQVAFKTGEYKQLVIFIGGLSDGFLATEYLEPLSIALDKRDDPLCKCSSLLHTLDMARPACNKMLQRLTDWSVVSLIKKTLKVLYYLDTVQVVGISSIIWAQMYLALGLYVLQFCRLIDLATTMRNEGRGSELMPREADPCAPITAERYYSLCAYMGDDDMFSSDLSDDQLKTRLGHMSYTPCQVIVSMTDEYVPVYVDKTALIERLCRALGGVEKVEIEHGNHSLSNRISDAVQAIIDFIKRE